MTAKNKYSPGEFCWTDLGTTNVVAAKKFYQSLFGWKVTDVPMGMGDAKYSMFSVGSKKVCALYSLPAEKRKSKIPPFWLPYISVKSVDATVRKAKTALGEACMPPMNILDSGRMAIVQDPSNAVIALWQAKTYAGAELTDKPGAVCWHDLNTSNTAAASKFYTKVFGWTMEDKDFGGHDYHLFKLGSDEVCGMCPMPHPKLPPCWLTHWEVEKCAKTVTKAKRLGGGALMPATQIAGMDMSFAVLTDPQGAAFGIIGA